MAITVKHTKVSTIPDTDDTSLVRPSDWNADHTLIGLGTMAEQDSNNVNITGGSITGVTGLGDVTGPASATDNAITRFDLTTGKLIQNSTVTLDDNGNIINANSLGLDTTPATVPTTVGTMSWDDGDGVPTVLLKGGNVNLQVGTQVYARVFNDSGTTLTKGQAVYISGAQGNRVAVKLARANVEATSFGTIGLVAETMTAGAEGYIIVSGALYKLNTLGLVAGATVYLSPTTAGALTTTKPQAPDQLVVVGWVERVDNNVGSIYVKVDNGYELDELHDVQITAPITTGQTLVYNGTTSVWQNSNAPTIVGGSINNTPIGATTPSTVNATTITGQTARLNGTGQNLLTYSQLIGGTNWSSVGTASVVTNAVSAPDATTTASAITVASGGYYRQITASGTISAGATYTLSCYVKASASGGAANVRLTTNNVNAWNTGFSTRFALTSSWQRVSVTGTITGNSSCYAIIGAIDATGTGDALCAGNVDVWGAQLEIASSVGTYVATTASAVYGTPTLSFSGVSTIGLESNGALFLQPAGTGALQAQATTSTSAGGNARGANAVDWQTLRSAASQVASGSYSTIVGGQRNTSGTGAFVGGGYQNNCTAYEGVIVGGSSNTSNNFQSFTGGGASNTNGGVLSVIGGGSTNTSNGYFNFIGGGFTNAGTALAAVTTQSGTMNGTTAVTLSGSNASIRVGQYITGTSIASDTYVAAISGTALTLSKNASGSSTSTLSFFTPHGVVVGGGNNQATGAYSFIGGGGDAGTAGNRNVASGDWSFVGGGARNVASGISSVICGGGWNNGFVTSTASGNNAFIGAGYSNTSSSVYATVLNGQFNTASASQSVVLNGSGSSANGSFSTIINGQNGTSRSIAANTIFPSSDPLSSVVGATQSAILVLARQTTDATPTVLASNSSAAGTTNQVILPNNSAYLFKATVISGVTGGGNTSGWKLEGVIKRGANAASTTIVGTVTTTLLAQDAGASTWTIAATADTTNGGLRFTFTGQAGTTIRTVCKVETTEMTF
jgi:hypothetical protein